MYNYLKIKYYRVNKFESDLVIYKYFVNSLYIKNHIIFKYNND